MNIMSWRVLKLCQEYSEKKLLARNTVVFGVSGDKTFFVYYYECETY